MIFRLQLTVLILLLSNSQVFAQNNTNSDAFEEASSVNIPPNPVVNPQAANNNNLPIVAEEPSSNITIPTNPAENPQAANNNNLPIVAEEPSSNITIPTNPAENPQAANNNNLPIVAEEPSSNITIPTNPAENPQAADNTGISNPVLIPQAPSDAEPSNSGVNPPNPNEAGPSNPVVIPQAPSDAEPSGPAVIPQVPNDLNVSNTVDEPSPNSVIIPQVPEENEPVVEVTSLEVQATSSSKPKTTKAPPATSTQSPVKPAPSFPKNVGIWSVIDPLTNHNCILVKGAIQLQYVIGPGGTENPQTIDVSPNALANGTCGNTTQTINLTWETASDNLDQPQWQNVLEMSFTARANHTDQYVLHEITLSYSNVNVMSVAQQKGTISIQGAYFPVNYNRSFICIDDQTIKDNNELRVLTADLQLEAFRPLETPKDTFSEPEICDADLGTFGTIIGISVGVVLLLLIAISTGVYCGVRYGFLNCPCCSRPSGYQNLDA